jgi:CheY-like chemotaxis protein
MNDAKRILVIEDDAVLRDLLADWLVAAGYRVAQAAEGGAGIANARAHRPALVVTDIHMPGSDGATVISEVGRIYPDVPIIAISGHFRSGRGLTPEDAAALGAACTLAKPFNRKDMVGAVMALAGPPTA